MNDRDFIVRDFRDAINMTADEIEEWLATPESRSVGQKRDGEESIGHASGRRIVEILRKPHLDESDHAYMRRVVGFISHPEQVAGIEIVWG